MVTYKTGNENDIISISKLLIDTWRSCYKDFVPLEFLEGLDLNRQIQRHYMLENIKFIVAENEHNESMAFSSYGNNRLVGASCEKEIYTLYVSKENQGIGIGKTLLNIILKEAVSERDRISVSIFEDNPYRSFYIRNGFEKIGEEIIDMGEFELIAGMYCK